MPMIHIRPATIDDLDILLQFEQGIIQAERPFDVTLKKEKIYYYDFSAMIVASNVELLVAEIEGEIVGCGYARIEEVKTAKYQHKHYAYLGFMYVVPEFRRMGINATVMEGLKKWCRSEGIQELRLEVYSENHKAIHAYEKAGFITQMVEMRMKLE